MDWLYISLSGFLNDSQNMSLMIMILILMCMSCVAALQIKSNGVRNHKGKQMAIEEYISFVFTGARILTTFIIICIFLLIDWNILLFITTLKVENIAEFFKNEHSMEIIKYGFYFIVFQLVIFAQGFGISSIVKLIENISKAIRKKEGSD